MNEETDTVKKIRMRTNGKDEKDTVPVYLISLVEHKSRVDYNVSMQLLRYIVCIWNEYGKEMAGRGKGDPGNKSFRDECSTGGGGAVYEKGEGGVDYSHAYEKKRT